MVFIVHYSCAVVLVFGSGGKKVLVLHTYVLRVQYNCGVVLVFWSWREIVIDVTYVLSVQHVRRYLMVLRRVPEFKYEIGLQSKP